jgi:hypothetical protein
MQRHELARQLDQAKTNVRKLRYLKVEEIPKVIQTYEDLKKQARKLDKEISEIQTKLEKEALKQRLREKAENIEIIVKDGSFGAVIPQGRLKLNKSLRVVGTLPCSHRINKDIFKLLETHHLINGLFNGHRISIFYPCNKKHNTFQGVTTKSFQLEFALTSTPS